MAQAPPLAPINPHDRDRAGRRIASRAGRSNQPVSLYPGKVMHARLRPAAHRFSYRVFNILIDIDRLDEADRLCRGFSVNRFNMVAFHEADHMAAGHASLRAYVNSLLQPVLAEPPARVMLACYPRILGRVFNPIAVYYAYERNDELAAMIYEVRNTFGERHTYVCAIEPGDLSPAGVRQARDKRFYVSPFIDMAMRYHFRMTKPGDRLTWRILETDADGPVLSATFSASRQAMTPRNLMTCLARVPLQTWKIVGSIHFEAARLWWKGVALVPRGSPPAPVSYNDRDAPIFLDPARSQRENFNQRTADGPVRSADSQEMSACTTQRFPAQS
jgi:uncharacterized protein